MREAPMRSRRKRALMATAVLIAFAAAAVPSFAGERSAAPSAGPADPRGGDQDQSALAEYYLSRLARRSKKTRNTAGGIGTAVGALSLAGGLALVGQDDEEDWLGLGEFFGTVMIVEGGLACVMGAYSLAVPSPAEKSYKRVRDISDPGERETACADALASLARKGRTSRMISGGLMCAVGVVSAIPSGDEGSSGSLLPMACAGGLALVAFLVKSPAERSYRAYLERSGVKPVPELILGIGPRGDVRAGLSLAF
jgi:hypothetical protein